MRKYITLPAGVQLLLAGTLAVIIAFSVWTVGKAYDTFAKWGSHSANYTFDPSVPSSFYSAINAGAFAWTNSVASTWVWFNLPTPSNAVKYVSIDGAHNLLGQVVPPPSGTITSFEMKFDTAENWYTGTGTPGGNQYDLQSIATHEFGHGLGLLHSTTTNCPGNSTNATMCPTYGWGETHWRTLENDDTLGLQALYPPLTQLYWRGASGYSRQVAIVNGTPDFNQAQSWTTPPAGGANPGTGNVQAWSNVVIGNKLYQEVWQSNVRWTRNIVIFGGIVQWDLATTWQSGLANFGTQPGPAGTDTQANNAYVIGTTLYQGYWRGDQGFSRTVPISTGAPQWGSASNWNGPVSLTTLPGTGSLQALSIYKVGGGLRQGIWRNNEGYSRTVPIASNAPDWNNAGPWTAPIPISGLDGSGDMRAQDNYELSQ